MRQPPEEPGTQTGQRPAATPVSSGLASTMRGIRLATGVVVVIFLFGLYSDTAGYIDKVSAPPFDASAIQITQVYAERLFYAVIAIGIAVSIYIGTRAADES